MSDEVKKVSALLITTEEKQKVQEVVTTEFSLTITLNNREIVTLLCTPRDLEWLAVGYLFSEGLIQSKSDITKITLDESNCAVRIETKDSRVVESEPTSKRFIASSGWRGSTLIHSLDTTELTKVSSKMQIATGDVFAMVEDFQGRSKIFKDTGGVHSAALCSTNSILLLAEDIGRHNAIDKIFGGCLLKDIDTKERAIMTSGRVSSEILLKVARRNMPILISKSSPTDVAVRLAEELGITLIGFVRGKKMNVYTGSHRVIDT
jgi:FdhD protein